MGGECNHHYAIPAQTVSDTRHIKFPLITQQMPSLNRVSKISSKHKISAQLLKDVPFTGAELTLKCYYDQKLTSIFFLHKSKVLMFNSYHAKLQVFISTRSVIN